MPHHVYGTVVRHVVEVSRLGVQGMAPDGVAKLLREVEKMQLGLRRWWTRSRRSIRAESVSAGLECLINIRTDPLGLLFHRSI